MGRARCFWGLSLPRGQNSIDNSENEAAKCSLIFFHALENGGSVSWSVFGRLAEGKAG